MKILLVSTRFPPAPGERGNRLLELATGLPELGIETHVLAPPDSRRDGSSGKLRPPTQAWIHRVGGLVPDRRGLPAWALVAAPAAVRLVRQEAIAAVVTISPPESAHLV